MNLNQFLDQNQYAVLILQWLELKKSTFCTLEQLCEFAGVSKFKAGQYIEDLNNKLAQLSPDAKISLEPSGELVISQVTYQMVQQVRAIYLTESEVFQLFNNTLNLELSLTDFSQKRFLGRTKSYDTGQKLKAILKEYQLFYKKRTIIGEEYLVRNLVFVLYLNFFYGIYNPFPEDISKQANQLMNLLISHLNLNLNLTQKNKMNLLLEIILIRTKHEHYCELETLDFSKVDDTSDIYEIFAKYFVTSEINKQNEWHYVLAFLISENLWPNKIDNQKPELKEMSTQFVHNLMQTADDSTPAEQDNYRQTFVAELNRLDLHYALFPIDIDFFTIQRDFTFLEDNYPNVVTQIQAITNLIGSDKLSFINKDRLYIDVFLAMLEAIPISKIDTKVYVCVDFTQGQTYTNFIIRQLEGFKSQNIIVQRKMNPKTDILITDYVVTQIESEQIIWKSPPNADDWEYFGNRVIAAKKRKKR